MKIKLCSISGCNKKHFAKGLCFLHWNRQHKYYTVPRKFGHRHKCKIKDCQNGTIKDYCSAHLYRIKNKLSLDLSIDYRHLRTGNKNNLWRGGVAEYPNHSLMKKNRLIILIHNPICELCNKKSAVEVHHKNGDKSDHRLSNLAAACHKCNSGIRFKPSNSKYRRLYGINLQEITDKFGRSEGYWSMHQKELITIFLDK